MLDGASRATRVLTGANLKQDIRYCRAADGVRLAFATVGSGPPLLRSAHWMGHLEYDWELPIFRHLLLKLASTFTVVRYDARGNGLSDWDVGDISLDAWVSDMLEAARKSWAAAGRAASDLRFETFGSSGLLPTESFRVRLKDTGAEIEIPQSRSMLAALNDAGYEVISDCQRGECGVCAIDVVAVEGEIDHRDVFFSDEQKHGNRKICPCVSRAVGTVTVDTLYRRDAA